MPETFYTKAVGVTFEGRQEFVRALKKGQYLQLVREPQNIRWDNAIAVYDRIRKIGYLSGYIVSALAEKLDNGYQAEAIVEEITGFQYDNQGVNLLVRVYAPNENGGHFYFTENKEKDEKIRSYFDNECGQQFIHDRLHEENQEKKDIQSFQDLLRRSFRP